MALGLCGKVALTKRWECEACWELQEERAAIHEHCGGATREEAERMASLERCPEHQPKPEQRELI